MPPALNLHPTCFQQLTTWTGAAGLLKPFSGVFSHASSGFCHALPGAIPRCHSTLWRQGSRGQHSLSHRPVILVTREKWTRNSDLRNYTKRRRRLVHPRAVARILTLIRDRAGRIFVIILAGLAVVWLGGIFAVGHWAFERDRIAKSLGDATSSTVEFRSYRHVYFPRPGCVAEGAVFRRKEDPSASPYITANKITIVTSFSGILRRHASLLEADGVQVIPGRGGWPVSSIRSGTEVERLVVKDSVLQVNREDGAQPLRFVVHELSLEDVGGKDGMDFKVKLTNAIPPGEIVAEGKLGPWNKQDRATSPIEGTYSFKHADLASIDGIGGLLASEGKFKGPINQLAVEGWTDTPEFEVTSTHKKFPLKTRFRAQVNGRNGDVILQEVQATLERTDVIAQGSVKPEPADGPRTALLDVAARRGNIQDVLFPFIHEPQSPVKGVTSFQGHIKVPAGEQPFVQRVAVQGDFGIDDARFTSSDTQIKVDKMSEQARGHPDADHPEEVVSDLKGHVVLKEGTATFSKLTFSVPGAVADMHGTYCLLNERINLAGTVQLQAKVSSATTGIKSFLVKALDPFIKKDRPEEPLPVAITGTYSHPQFSVSLTGKKKQAESGE